MRANASLDVLVEQIGATDLDALQVLATLTMISNNTDQVTGATLCPDLLQTHLVNIGVVNFLINLSGVTGKGSKTCADIVIQFCQQFFVFTDCKNRVNRGGGEHGEGIKVFATQRPSGFYDILCPPGNIERYW